MRKLRKGPSWKAAITMENFEDKKEDGSGKRRMEARGEVGI